MTPSFTPYVLGSTLLRSGFGLWACYVYGLCGWGSSRATTKLLPGWLLPPSTSQGQLGFFFFLQNEPTQTPTQHVGDGEDLRLGLVSGPT